MKWGRSQRQNESAKGKFRKKEEKGDKKTEQETDKLTVERENLESGQSAHKQNFLWNHWGQQNQRGSWRTEGRNIVQLPSLSFIFSYRKKKFFLGWWRHEHHFPSQTILLPACVLQREKQTTLHRSILRGCVLSVLILLLSENRSSKWCC